MVGRPKKFNILAGGSKSSSYPQQRIKADYGMWGLDYERLDGLLREVDKGFLNVRKNINSDPYLLEDLVRMCRRCYSVIRPIVDQSNRMERIKIDKRFDELMVTASECANSLVNLSRMNGRPGPELFRKVKKLITDVEMLHDDVLVARQRSGMGIHVSKVKTAVDGLAQIAGIISGSDRG